MEIKSDKDRSEMVFRNEYKGKPSYSIGLSKKDKDGNYTNGYIKANFKEGTEINNKARIKINSAFLSFYKDDKDKTIPTIYVSDFEIVEDGEVAEETKEEKNPFEEFGDSITTEFDVGHQIEIEDSELPF